MDAVHFWAWAVLRKLKVTKNLHCESLNVTEFFKKKYFRILPMVISGNSPSKDKHRSPEKKLHISQRDCVSGSMVSMTCMNAQCCMRGKKGPSGVQEPYKQLSGNSPSGLHLTPAFPVFFRLPETE
ncbi:uncharacterized protein LOC144318506 isoform X2 [Canis aureus]